MSESEARSAVVLELAEEFLERYRRGERPPLKEYIDRYPHLEAEIREVFPAMAMMERVGLADASLADDPTAPAKSLFSPPCVAQLGDYRIIREVGRGGMGVVYEAEQVSLGRPVALKVLLGRGLLNSTHRERFRREVKAAARLHHSNIVPVFGTGEVEGTHYYAMQFIRGEGLDRVLRDLRRSPPQPHEPPDDPQVDLTRSAAHGLTAGSIANPAWPGPTPGAETPAPASLSGLSASSQSGGVGGQRQGHRIVPHPASPHLLGDAHRFALVGGSIYSTATDVASFARMVLASGRMGDIVVLSADAAQEFIKPQFTDQRYGLGWVLETGPGDKVTRLLHNGTLAAYRGVVHIDLDRGLYIVVLVTLVHADDEADSFIQTIQALAWQTLVGRPAERRK